jgi:hypothetical protein
MATAESMCFKSCLLRFPGSGSNDTGVASMIEGCKAVKDAKAVEKDADYSIGTTYFIRADETPSNLLEECALAIFRHHTSQLVNQQPYDANLSGAEWWTQVIDSRDDIGFHWDRDYGNYFSHFIRICTFK